MTLPCMLPFSGIVGLNPVEGGCSVHDPAVFEYHRGFAQGLYVLQRVVFKHDQVGQFAGLDRADLILHTQYPGIIDCDALQDFGIAESYPVIDLKLAVQSSEIGPDNLYNVVKMPVIPACAACGALRRRKYHLRCSHFFHIKHLMHGTTNPKPQSKNSM